MTIRANSLRSVLMDGLLMTFALGLVALFATSARPAEGTLDPRPDSPTTDSIDSRLNTDDNQPSGDPTETPADQSETNVLGMKLREVEAGRVVVTDVSATSPAWNAGIRRGDELIELHGVRPTDFSKWSRDIATLLRATQDGQAVPIEIDRRGERISLRVTLPESRAAAVRDARQEERAIAELPQRQSQGQRPSGGPEAASERGYGRHPSPTAPYGPAWSGGGIGILADETGNTDNERDDRAATNAIAELYRVGTLETDGRAQTGGSNQVGLAAFQNNGQGVAAHVEVHGLPQGSYQVGIGDGGNMTGSGYVSPFDAPAGEIRGENGAANGDPDVQQEDRFRPAPSPGDNRERRRRPVSPQNQPQIPGPNQPSVRPTDPTSPNTPVPGSGGPTSPAAGRAGQSSSLARPGNGYVAQQIPHSADTPSGPNPTANSAGDGEIQSPSAPGAQPQQQGLHAWRRSGLGRENGVPPTAGGVADMANFLIPIGTIQVAADGVGRVQNQLEGVAVRNLAGLSVVVAQAVSEAGPGGNLPEATANAGGRTSGQRRNLTDNSQFGNRPGIVATGNIRIVEGSGLPRQPSSDPTQRANEAMREAGQRNELQRDQFSPTAPDQTFNPSGAQSR